MASEAPSLAGRAALAVLLMVGFYLLALAIAAGLIAIPVVQHLVFDRSHLTVVLWCIGGAVLIVWSVLPRWDRFPPPGVPLREEEQPELFSAIGEVAQAAGQAMPREVYLVPELNAFVAQRGGVMGFFSRRVLGIGLPLLCTLEVDQMRAVLAHEFGHFHGGDTKLGPWIYKTRSAIGRTLQTLEGRGSVLRHPFRWYGNLFLRITLAISRAQEFAADRLAARLVGAAPLRDGLLRLPALAMLYDTYLQREVAPVLSAGLRPPFAEGLQLFLADPSMVRASAEITAAAAQRVEADPYDTHPPTAQRVQALEQLRAEVGAARDARPAWIWLRDVEQLELEVLAFATGNQSLETLPALAWSDVAEAVWVPIWRAQTERLATLREHPLAGLRLGDLPAALTRAGFIGAHGGLTVEGGLPEPQREEYGFHLLGAAAGLALHAAGFRASALPGGAIVLRRGEHEFSPVAEIRQHAEGTLDASAWRERCAAAGVAELPLVPA